MELFNLNPLKLWRSHIPAKLKKARLQAFVDAIMFPFQQLYNEFVGYFQAKSYYLNHNSQVIKLEAALNDRYDFANREITINTAPYTDHIYISTVPEDRPVYLDNPATIFIPTEAEIGFGEFDFIINIPATVSFNEGELRSLVDAYKLPGKTYTLNIT
ncbi:MAG: hypothetical protein RBS07_15735 [Lentimicrobium sp.]|jgi:hypothetical protein|nr:hypothetical protein [Lentimicrobium sp.]